MKGNQIRINASAIHSFFSLAGNFLIAGVVAVMVCLCVGKSPAQANTQSAETFTLSLNNVDINSLIETVSARTGKNFIVDPRVKGKVTVVSSEPVNADRLYELFLSVLDVHGFAAVPAGSFIKIVPMAVGVQSAVPVISDQSGSADELVTSVITLDYISAAQVVEALRPLVPAPVSLGAEVASNTVVITDRAANIARLKEIIRQLDIPR